MKEKSFFLSRLKSNVSIFELDGKSPFNLLAAVKKYGSIDVDVCIGSTHRLPVRLVAQKLPEPVAAERRRKAKTNRDRRCKPSKQSLALLGWQILITNVDRNIWSAQNVCEVYGLRWRIEIIFKSWKSHFHMADVPKANAIRIKAYIYSALIFVTLFHALIFNTVSSKAKSHSNVHISRLKLSKFFKEQLWVIPLVLQKKIALNNFIDQIIYHSCYEKRQNRVCYPEILAALS
jgi:hypothetical protein